MIPTGGLVVTVFLLHMSRTAVTVLADHLVVTVPPIMSCRVVILFLRPFGCDYAATYAT